MIYIYEKDWKNGVPAPFLEYALSSDWMDKSLVHRWKLWEGDGRIVGLVFYEDPVNDVYFSLRPGYEKLADEMVAYAVSSMPRVNGYLRFVIFSGQNAVKEAAAKAGFQQSLSYIENVFDFEQSLNYSLPDGFHFVESKRLSMELAECCWKGFDHEKENAKEGAVYEIIKNGLHMQPDGLSCPDGLRLRPCRIEFLGLSLGLY